MKKLFILQLIFVVSLFIACDSEPDANPNITPDPNPGTNDSIVGPNDTTIVQTPTAFDVWLQVQGTNASGMYVARVDSAFDTSSVVSVEGYGVEVDSKLRYSAIHDGEYYYDITQSEDGFGKYKVTKESFTVVKEIPFGDVAYVISMGAKKASTTWLDDNTLLFMKDDMENAGTGILWTKLNTETMKIIDEGKIVLSEEENDPFSGNKFASTGQVVYRHTDNTILYFTTKYENWEKVGLMVVAIDSKDMSVKGSDVNSEIAPGLAYESFGNSFEDKAYVDENGDAYVSCQRLGAESGTMGSADTGIARVKNGTFVLDAEYGAAYPKSTASDILITKYLKSGKAMMYIRDYARAGEDGVGNTGVAYNAYYAIYDNASKTFTPVQYDGKDLPWSSGRFANRMCNDGKYFYLGLNTEAFGEDAESYIQAEVYVYDIQSDKVVKGFEIDGRAEFFRMHTVK